MYFNFNQEYYKFFLWEECTKLLAQLIIVGGILHDPDIIYRNILSPFSYAIDWKLFPRNVFNGNSRIDRIPRTFLNSYLLPENV